MKFFLRNRFFVAIRIILTGGWRCGERMVGMRYIRTRMEERGKLGEVVGVVALEPYRRGRLQQTLGVYQAGLTMRASYAGT